LFDVLPDDLQWNATGWLEYDEKKPHLDAKTVDEFNPLDDMDLVPHDELERLPEPDRVVTLDVIMDNLGDGANYAFFNNITYAAPKVPTLYTALTTGELAINSQVYGEFTHPFVLQKDEIVQIVLNNQDDGRHPFHIHGHNFQAIYRSAEDAGSFEDSGITEDDFPETPMRRDTLLVWPNGNIVMRFKADNPGMPCRISDRLPRSLLTRTFRSLAIPLSSRVAPDLRLGRDLYRGTARAPEDPGLATGPP
jgi:iron transport multicopper oxidase